MTRISFAFGAAFVAILQFPTATLADVIGLQATKMAGSDRYFMIEAAEGGLEVEAFSDAFDTTLTVAAPDRSARYDDDSGGGYNSRIHVPESAGTWYATVSSYGVNGSGDFFLIVTRARRVDPVEADDIPGDMRRAMEAARADTLAVRPVTPGAENQRAQARGDGDAVFTSRGQDALYMMPSDRAVALGRQSVRPAMLEPHTAAVQPSGPETQLMSEELSALRLETAEEQSLPPLLPWPPPLPSGKETLPHDLFVRDAPLTFGDVDRQLRTALSSVGHDEVGYYHVPGGFAIVTRLERTEEDGDVVEADRWVMRAPRPEVNWSLVQYIKALTTATTGYFRVLAFVVTPDAFRPSQRPVEPDTINEWAILGSNVLPDGVQDRPFDASVEVTVLIYEMSKIRGAQSVVVHVPGRLTGPDHLRRLGLAAALGSTR